MNILFHLILLFSVLLATGCAATGVRDADGRPWQERLSSTSYVAPASAKPTLMEIVAMEHAGRSPAQIVQSLRDVGIVLPMDAAQQKTLRDAGASPTLIAAFIGADHQAREASRLTAEADKAAARRERIEAYEAASYAYPYGYPYGGFSPFFGYGTGSRSSGWFGGMSWGW